MHQIFLKKLFFFQQKYAKASRSRLKLIHGRKGFGTLEVVIIIAVLLAIALIFRKTLINYASSLINAVFDQSIIDDMGNYELGQG